jgi:DNA-binding MarR family transcriptional regulator
MFFASYSFLVAELASQSHMDMSTVSEHVRRFLGTGPGM